MVRGTVAAPPPICTNSRYSLILTIIEFAEYLQKEEKRLASDGREPGQIGGSDRLENPNWSEG